MKHSTLTFIFGILILVLASACGPVPATPVNPGPGAGIVANNPGQSVGLAPSPAGQTSVPPIATKPSVIVPNGISTVASSNASLPQACIPPVSPITVVSTFCANNAAGLGGVEFNFGNSSADNNTHFYNPPNTNCQDTANQICSGPQGTDFTAMVCTSCGILTVNGNYACPNGYVKQPNGNCLTDAQLSNGVQLCPAGTHYNNTLQNCADDVTGKIASPCPAGYPYYFPDLFVCMQHSEPVTYDCQAVQIPLGACTSPVKKIPGTGNQCPPGKTLTWDPLVGKYVCK